MNSQISSQVFLGLHWHDRGIANPILRPPAFSPIIADPAVLTPTESPDGNFHLFAHSVWGIHHYTSLGGREFKPWPTKKPPYSGLILRHAMRPALFVENRRYYLLYEKYRPFQIIFSWAKFWKWSSQIECVSSTDLRQWSKPVPLLRPSLSWHSDSPYGRSVSNPYLLKVSDRYRLYYSASLRLIPDCGFCEPAHIGLAESDSVLGPYSCLPEPILSPDPNTTQRNLAAGAIKVLAPFADGLIALHNGIYTQNGRSGSAIFALFSKDGYQFEYAATRPILAPTAGWRRSHVYAFDCRYEPRSETWFLYFNGRDDWHWTKGKECIGLVVASTK